MRLSLDLGLGSVAINQGGGVFGPVTNSAGLGRWRVARDDLSSVSPLVWAVGDSITWGVGYDGTNDPTSEDGARLHSYPAKLAGKMAARYGGVDSRIILPGSPTVGSTDSLVVASSATAVGSMGLLRFCRQTTSTGPGTITFSIPACTAFDLIYWESNGTSSNPTTGNFTYAVDGGGAVAVNYASTVAAYKVVSVTGLAATTHTVVVTGASANTTYHCGIIYRSANSVVVGRFGRPGYTILDALAKGEADTQSAAGQVRRLAAFGMANPALTIISFGTNDCMKQFNSGFEITPATFKANIQSAANAAIAAGASVLLMGQGEPPYAQPEGGEPFSAYRAAMREIAEATTHCAFVDINNAWGGATAAIANGFQNSGSVHPTIAGYEDIARRLDILLAA